MLSKEMYDLLVDIPCHPKTLFAGKLYENSPRAARIQDLLCEAFASGYINHSQPRILNSDISLTEKGQALIEEYETSQENQRIVKDSLKVAIAAKRVAIASAIAAFLALIPQLPGLIDFLAQVMGF